AGEDTITARIKRDSFGVVVTLDGLPADGVIADSRLEIGGQYYRVTFSQPSGRTALSESVEPIDAAKASFRPKPDAPRSQPLPVMPGLVTHPVSEAFSLQGAGDRADAVAAQVQSGNYGCLYLKVTSSTIPGVPAKQGLITSRWLMARIVAPIEGATP
ncbi:MAG: hypothetical protein ACOYN0_18565, partial [Phycisphaerales bacterium]